MNKLATLSSVKEGLSRFASLTGLKVKEYSPEILMVSGVASIVVGTVLACKATLKIEEILDEAQDDIATIEEGLERYDGTGRYTDEDAKKDKLIVYGRMIKKFAITYGPSAICLVSGIVMICSSHGIMKKRNAALMAAYQAVDLAFKNYRQRVVEEEGELKDRHYLTGAEYKEIENPETGEKEIVEETSSKNVSPSLYTKFFDETSRYWKKDANMNRVFLTCVQNQLNTKLREQGYLFLNQVYEALDILPTPAGQVAGWVYKEGVKVDLGIFDESDPVKRRFVNGLERSVRIDPNVQGIVWELIEDIEMRRRGLI